MKKFLLTLNFSHLKEGFVIALLLSSFIYLEHYGLRSYILNTVFGVVGLYLLLKSQKQTVLFFGFFIGILWFYWISYSFKYNGVGYIAPFVVVGFGFVYMFFFSPLALTNNPYMRAAALFALSFYSPANFNWLRLELPFVHSYIGVYKWQFALLLFVLATFMYLQNKKLKPLVLLGILATINYNFYPPQNNAPLAIKLVQTDVPQEYKWTKEAIQPTILMVYKEIEQATKEGYDVVVLPESVVPLFLNTTPVLIEQFQILSKQIDIVLGSLLLEKNNHYNVTYHFAQDGTYEVAKKVVLVPFGEYIPLPDFLKHYINDVFFAGASDFVTAKKPTDFTIQGVKFRNAICYEATSALLYQDNPKYIIATSNNGWFTPSIEPTLQKLLMSYYAKKHGTTIYHSANRKGSGVIK